MLKKAFWPSGRFLLTVAIAALAWSSFLNQRSNHVLRSWRQPKEIIYDGEEHSLAIIQADRKWSLFDGFSWRYDIFVGKTGNIGDYGHFVAWPFDRHSGTPREALDKVDLAWTNEGVTLTDSLGRRVFIPKRLFIGGR